jgi:Ca-activated chloride channel family protein
MKRWRIKFAAGWFCLALLGAMVAGQTPDDEIVRVETDLVTVEALVTDANGNIANNLRPEDFKLYEDGREMPLSFFSVAQRARQDRPVAVVLALDVSGSVTADELAHLRRAVNAFIGRLAGGSSMFAVLSFGTQVKTVQSLTDNAEKLEKSLGKLAADPNGLSTHAYDAVDDAIRLLTRKAPRTRERRLLKRAVIVVSDGFPVGDTVAPATVIERANAADVSVYTVILPSYSRFLADRERKPLPTPLDVSGLAEKTGGASLYANAKDFEPLFRSLAEDVASTYILSFYPVPEKRRDGRFHTLRVEVPRGYFVRQSRPGYQARTGDHKKN